MQLNSYTATPPVAAPSPSPSPASLVNNPLFANLLRAIASPMSRKIVV
ncbi:MAG: hypothetical protein ACYTX0_34020 [Nostoc sp.]